MPTKTLRLFLSLALLSLGAAFAADGSKSAPAKAVKAKSARASEQKSKEGPAPSRKVGLGEAFVAGNVLLVMPGRPVSLSLFNARGEQLLHLENIRETRSFPLTGINAGFLYLTFRSGSLELTQKLVYTGK